MLAKILKNFAAPMWSEDEGVLTFEWILLITLLTIGIVSGVTAARDALIDEMGDVAEATISIDQSFTLAADPCFGTGAMNFSDTKSTFTSCERGTYTVQDVTTSCSVMTFGS